MNNVHEIIISDGGSKDNTVDVIEHISKSYPIPVKVINSKPGKIHYIQVLSIPSSKRNTKTCYV